MKNVVEYLHRLRARLGAKWCVIALLIPPTAFGIYHFGPRAALVVASSVLLCVLAGILPRMLSGQPFQWLHPGTIITGLLLGLTLSTNTPLYMIVVGALVAQLPGKYVWRWLGRNPFNPAALGRTAVAVLEYFDTSGYGSSDQQVDIATGASALFKAAGGHARPELSDLFMGFHPGAIGETSELLLIPVGILLLWFVVIKRHAAVAMIVTVPLLIISLPASADVVGHAPWVYNPLMYLLGSNTLLLAIFFVTDPKTTPQTRLGGTFFGVGVACLGVAGRLYTTIPGAEMYAVLIMNLAVVVLDGTLTAKLRQRPEDRQAADPLPPLLPGETNGSRVEPFPQLEVSAAHSVRTFFAETGKDAEADVPDSGSLTRIASPADREPFSEYKKLVTACSRESVSETIQLSDLSNRKGSRLSKFETLVAADNRKRVLHAIKAGGLRGCGGARFPVHVKWETVLKYPGPRVLIANGQEGEPETFKDRYLMRHHARLVVEGIAIAAFVIDAREIIAVVTVRSSSALKAMTEAVAQFQRLDESSAIPPIKVVPGPDLYVCGEETALIESLESNRGEPRPRPPLPVESGLHGQPTLVQNVETLSWLPSLLYHGPKWFRASGGGYQLVSLSGAVKMPGVYEVETGTLLKDIVAMGGGLVERMSAIAVGGPSGGLLPASRWDLPFEQSALRAAGTMMGTGAVRVLGVSENLVHEALVAATFFRDESCGRCTPCRVGTAEVVRLWQEIADGDGNQKNMALIRELADVMRRTSTCGLGAAAAGRVLSVMDHWPEQFELNTTVTNTKGNC